MSLTVTREKGKTMAHRHQFDPISGYCGCGLRDDGRLIVNGVEWQPGGRHNLPPREETTDHDRS